LISKTQEMKGFLLVACLTCFFTSADSQQRIIGTVNDHESGIPVPFATIYNKSKGIAADSAGRFTWLLDREPLAVDSFTITAVGYFDKHVSARDLRTDSRIYLDRQTVYLSDVRIEASLKGDYKKFSYLRAASLRNIGAEIGYVFNLIGKRFFLGTVQLKIDQNLDVCWLKLHLRNVSNKGLELPDEDILQENIILPVTNKSGLVEFDLNWQEILTKDYRVYVGFELLSCGCTDSEHPSFWFVGNEEGVNFFREDAGAIWQKGGDYTIYVRMIYTYNAPVLE